MRLPHHLRVRDETDIWLIGYCWYIAPGAPLSLSGRAMSPSSILLSWSPANKSSLEPERYEVYFSPVESQRSIRVAIPSSLTSYLLQDLTPSTRYHISIAAEVGNVIGKKSEVIHVTTMESRSMYCFQRISIFIFYFSYKTH